MKRVAIYLRVSPCACRKSNSHIQMVKSAEEWRLHNAANGMNGAR
jgi:hypothetical protein